jgi:hypothetical protein
MSLRPTTGLVILPILHMVLCVVVYFTPNDWQWFPVFMVDLPLSIVIQYCPFPPIAVRWLCYGESTYWSERRSSPSSHRFRRIAGFHGGWPRVYARADQFERRYGYSIHLRAFRQDHGNGFNKR